MRRLGLLAVVLVPAVARADAAPPPTGLIDVAHLGPVGGVAAFAVVYGGACWLYRRMRQRGRTVTRSFLWALALVVAGNLTAYFFAMTVIAPRERNHRYEERERKRSEPNTAHPILQQP